MPQTATMELEEQQHHHSKPHSSLVERADAPTTTAAGEDLEKHEESTFVPATAAEEAAIRRKLDFRLLPIVLLIYMLAVLDRSNLGNAHVAGLDESIGLHGTQYATLGTIFYIGYIVFQWTAAGWKHFRPHIWCPLVVLAWSSISTLQAAVSNFGGLAALRFLLGVFEAMYAGLPIYLSFFYPRDKLGFRQGVFLSGSALANAYGGALGYAIVQIKSHLEPWRILFLIEGLPTLITAVAAYFFLPDSIADAKFLTEREKEVATHAVRRGQVTDAEQPEGLRVAEFWAAFRDWRSYIPGIMYFSCNVSFASLPLFVPTIISEIGTFGTLRANGLSSPPYLLTFLLILLISWTSDRVRLRGPFVTFFALLSAVGFILLATRHDAAPRYLGIYLAITVFVCVAILLVWVSNIHSTESKRAGGWAIFATMGQLGPLVGTNLFPPEEKPYYRKGSLISMAFCLLIAVLSALFSFLLHRENQRMVREGEIEEVAEETRHDGRAIRAPRGFKYII